jgi:hypothetical protein
MNHRICPITLNNHIPQKTRTKIDEKNIEKLYNSDFKSTLKFDSKIIPKAFFKRLRRHILV